MVWISDTSQRFEISENVFCSALMILIYYNISSAAYFVNHCSHGITYGQGGRLASVQRRQYSQVGFVEVLFDHWLTVNGHLVVVRTIKG